MTQNRISLVEAVILAVVVAIITGLVIVTFMPRPVQVASASPAGTTFSTAKIAAVAAALSSPGSTGTSTSILNSDANDRYITGIKIACSGVGSSNTAYTGTGLASLTVFAATSSAASPAANNFSANKIGGGNFTISTSTGQFTLSSTTANGGTSTFLNTWAAGSYLTFTTNATNTASCAFVGEYVAS